MNTGLSHISTNWIALLFNNCNNLVVNVCDDLYYFSLDQTIELYNNDIDFKLQILRRYT